MNAASENVRINDVYRRLLFLGVALILVACGKDRPAATPISPTAPLIIPTLRTVSTPTVIPPTQSTLPPTWTPVPTPTPFPTRTPTNTPTPLSTLTAQQVCSNFSIILSPAANTPFDYEGVVGFGWHGVPDGASVVLSITQPDQGEVSHAAMPVSGDGVLSIPLARIPGDGQYDWKLWLQDPRYGAICEHSGSFLRQPPPFM